jgi:hypothetical protein
MALTVALILKDSLTGPFRDPYPPFRRVEICCHPLGSSGTSMTSHDLVTVNRPFNCGLLSSPLLNSTTGNAVALAQSELVGIVKAGRARLAYDCQLGIGHLVGRVQRDRIDAIAGVMVLSEVARRLMMMSGSGASTCSTECGRSATSRLTEVTTTTVPAGHRRPGVPGQEL